MKISQTKNTKACVARTQKTMKGNLYRNPVNSEKECYLDLSRHVKTRCNEAQRLYEVLLKNNNPVIGVKTKAEFCSINKNKKNKTYSQIKEEKEKRDEEDKKVKSAALKIINQFNSFMKESVKEKDVGKARKFLSNPPAIFFSFEESVSVLTEAGHGDFSDKIVECCLRNSLRKVTGRNRTNVKMVFKELFAAYTSDDYKKNYGLISESRINDLLELFIEDYWKTKQKENISRSIINQHVKTQSLQDDGDRLALSFSEKKRPLMDYLIRYADGDKSQRDTMLIQFRRLILLYYCGSQKYEDSLIQSPGVWSFGSLLPENTEKFCESAWKNVLNLAQENEAAKEREIQDEIRQDIRLAIAEHYRSSVKYPDLTPEDKYWLGFIEDIAEKLLLRKSRLQTYKLLSSWLCEKTWKEFLSFLSMKYISFGKGVYHFVMSDGSPEGKSQIAFKSVLPEYREGINSFDYEFIKARENFERDLSTYITFAANNFHRAVAKKGASDILLWTREELSKNTYPNVKKRIFRFFGGIGKWENENVIQNKDEDIAEAIRNELYEVRNENFHYTGTAAKENEVSPIIEKLFQKEVSELSSLYSSKFISNNVIHYYKSDDIIRLMLLLFRKKESLSAQLPAFNNILNRSHMMEAVKAYVMGKSLSWITDMEEFKSALYFVFKEIYYNGFLMEEDLKERFLKSLEKLKESAAEGKQIPVIVHRKGKGNDEKAVEDFYSRIKEINTSNTTFGEICQRIMTDYNMNNNGEKRVGFSSKQKYKHYPMLLYLCIRNAFMEYLKEDNYKFLRSPSKSAVTEEDFFNLCRISLNQDQMCGFLDGLEEDFRKNSSVRAWYTAAHFLDPKNLNHLTGTIKSYLAFLQDIDRRSKETGNRSYKDKFRDEYAKYEKTLRILDICREFNGNVSNNISDYFEDEEEYAAYIEKFVDYKKKGDRKDSLIAFCDASEKASPSKKIGIYYDGKNPILNRNVVLTSMYGCETILKCMEKVTEQEIRKYYSDMNKNAEILKRGGCLDIKEQQQVKDYQNMKNRIELRDVRTMMEIVNDLYGRLVTWVYFRERDLMYFQLGFYYIKLFYGRSVPEGHFLRSLKGKNVNITDGAVLYQIMAMYTYHLPVYSIDENGQAVSESESSTSNSIITFRDNYCKGDESIYDAGLELFENVKQHREYIIFRNDIEHFKYFSKPKRSILDLYAEMYDSFLQYDTNLKKSVGFVFEDVLRRNFVEANLSFLRNEVMETGFHDKQEKIIRQTSRLSVEEGSMKASVHTCRLTNAADRKVKASKDIAIINISDDDRKKVKIFARSDKFLDQLRKILEYSTASGK